MLLKTSNRPMDQKIETVHWIDWICSFARPSPPSSGFSEPHFVEPDSMFQLDQTCQAFRILWTIVKRLSGTYLMIQMALLEPDVEPDTTVTVQDQQLGTKAGL